MNIRKSCSSAETIQNTGSENDCAMGAIAGMLAVPGNWFATDADIADFATVLAAGLHEDIGKRIYPLFGQAAPINEINNNAEADVVVTLDDGSKVFVRYGIYNREFSTTSGGLCYAKKLKSLQKSGYKIIEIDQDGQLQFAKNLNGTHRGLAVNNMYAPTPSLADFKNPYKNKFQYSFTPTELVNNGEIFSGGADVLSTMGLLDVELGLVSASITQIVVTVKTECAGTDLVASLGTPLANLTNFVITNKATGVVVTPTAVAIVGGNLQFTGTFTSGSTYLITGTSAKTWFTNTIDGYDAASGTLTVLIP